IGTGVSIDGGGVKVEAIDELNRYAIAGGVVASEQVGIGISVAVDLVKRTVRAYVGRLDPDHAPAPAARGTIDVGGTVKIDAVAKGNLFSLVVGGAFPSERKPPTGDNTKHQQPAAPTTTQES